MQPALDTTGGRGLAPSFSDPEKELTLRDLLHIFRRRRSIVYGTAAQRSARRAWGIFYGMGR